MGGRNDENDWRRSYKPDYIVPFDKKKANLAVFKTRTEAEEVFNAMLETASEYGLVTVANYYDYSGIKNDYMDSRYGWSYAELKVLNSTKVIKHTYYGYILDLPASDFLK